MNMENMKEKAKEWGKRLISNPFDTCLHIAMYIMGGQDNEEKPNQMRILLKRWYSWLKPGGKLIMETSKSSL